MKSEGQWKNHPCLSSRFVSSDNSTIIFAFHLIVCHCKTKQMFVRLDLSCSRCLSESQQPGSWSQMKLDQLKSFLSWCQRCPKPLLLLLPGLGARGVFSPHDHSHLTASRVQIAWQYRYLRFHVTTKRFRPQRPLAFCGQIFLWLSIF